MEGTFRQFIEKLEFQNKLFVKIIYAFICWGFSSHSRIFHSFGDVTITGEKLQILNNALHLWPVSSVSSLEYQMYCDIGHSFIIKDAWHSHLLPSVRGDFYDLGLLHLRFEHPTSHLRGVRSNRLLHLLVLKCEQT